MTHLDNNSDFPLKELGYATTLNLVEVDKTLSIRRFIFKFLITCKILRAT